MPFVMMRPPPMHWQDQIDERTRRVEESTDAEEINELGAAAESASANRQDPRERAAWAELNLFATKKLARMGQLSLVYERDET